MRPTSVIRIDLASIDANIQAVRRLVGPACRLCPIVKADAYGLGARRIARRLAPASHLLAVYSPVQAVELLEHRVSAPSLVLMPVDGLSRGDELYRALLGGGVHLTVHDAVQAKSLARSADRLGLRIPVHVEVDTGLRRGGVDAAAAGVVLEMVLRSRSLRLAGVMTHFSDARHDPVSMRAQLERLDSVLESHRLPETCLVHAASTHALLRERSSHRDMVRFGLAWAGYGLGDLEDAERLDAATSLRAAVTWSSEVVHVKRVPTGAGVGYGSTWTAARPSTIGLVPVGYADGFPTTRHGASLEVVVRTQTGRRDREGTAAVIGAVSMDQIVVDLTDLLPEGASADLLRGADVELLGTDPERPNYLPTVAERAGLLSHELLCRLDARIPRVHVVGMQSSGSAESVTGCEIETAAAMPLRTATASNRS